jgi:hypothetical protein
MGPEKLSHQDYRANSESEDVLVFLTEHDQAMFVVLKYCTANTRVLLTAPPYTNASDIFYSRKDADAYASHLAETNPGDKFVILQAVGITAHIPAKVEVREL